MPCRPASQPRVSVCRQPPRPAPAVRRRVRGAGPESGGGRAQSGGIGAPGCGRAVARAGPVRLPALRRLGRRRAREARGRRDAQRDRGWPDPDPPHALQIAQRGMRGLAPVLPLDHRTRASSALHRRMNACGNNLAATFLKVPFDLSTRRRRRTAWTRWAPPPKRPLPCGATKSNPRRHPPGSKRAARRPRSHLRAPTRGRPTRWARPRRRPARRSTLPPSTRTRARAPRPPAPR
mmetsp:Transcript_19853/g.52200  ORF Transcript_19853/g.52200 Transcript_19853/m.52200 type:complete len:235 (+) Transcript_19853:245-949(+)